ncbi:platelet glycoprotein 4 isoform X2 [Salminus brasiliensis]|uniref:platelet glycoprotein 4 isoform X2 n=1 Tax=Salminus brasiliensis TaxID=930266 RepID=UPI003B836846
MGCSCCSTRCWLIAGSVTGAVLCLLGVILILVGNTVIEDTVKKEAVLGEGTTAYETWTSTGTPIYRQFWLFDVQNPNDVTNGSIPKLVQRGPYTYRTRYIPKQNISFSENHTVSFLLPAGAVFEPSLSVGSEEDTVTSINLAVAYNNTFDGPYNVFTGKDDITRVAYIDNWRGQPTMSFWNNTYCDMINGTDGSSFPPFLDKERPLYFFSSDICRSVYGEYESNQDLKGITVYRYALPDSTFASPTVNPDNQCFCTNYEATKNCTMAGVLDTKVCTGSPVFISLPHFLHGSSDLLEAVHGLKPDAEEHSTFLDVEPITGFTLRFAKRLQVNMMYGPSKDIKILQQIKQNTMFPILWLNETAALDDKTADRLKSALFGRMQMLEVVQISLIVVGAVLFVLCLIGICVQKSRSRKIIA